MGSSLFCCGLVGNAAVNYLGLHVGSPREVSTIVGSEWATLVELLQNLPAVCSGQLLSNAMDRKLINFAQKYPMGSQPTSLPVCGIFAVE